MKTKHIFFSILLVGIVAAVLLAGAGYAQEFTDSQPDGSSAQTHQAAQGPGDDSNPEGAPEVIIPDKYRPAEGAGASPAAAATVYFTPQDENTSTTVLFLYNTSTLTATVGIETFRTLGHILYQHDRRGPAGQPGPHLCGYRKHSLLIVDGRRTDQLYNKQHVCPDDPARRCEG